MTALVCDDAWDQPTLEVWGNGNRKFSVYFEEGAYQALKSTGDDGRCLEFEDVEVGTVADIWALFRWARDGE